MSITAEPNAGANSDVPAAPNAHRLLWAGFFAILAAGIGFAIRGGILGAWSRQYGLSFGDIGVIGGAGLTGFCFGIIIGGVIADKIGYGWLVIAAFLFHVLSAVVTFLASDSVLAGVDINISAAKASTFKALYWGTFIFALANGVLEAVANPLVATLFPHNRTHYLNILHASWPAGLVLGGVCGWVLGEQYNIYWKDQLALFLIPTVLYGLLFLGQQMPKSEASKQGLSLGEMFKDVGILGGLVVCFLLSLFLAGLFRDLLSPSPEGMSADMLQRAKENATLFSNIIGYGIGGALLVVIAVITNFSIGSFLLFVLFIAHALVGAVELGTDSWIQNITGNLLTTGEGRILFVFASMLMFVLRFCSDFIEKKMGMSPIMILLACSILAFIGLQLSARITSFEFALLAIGIYGVGKTFFWPTMLAVASDQFPRTGAVAISMMGGIGMLSAGVLGSPGLGYAKDYYAKDALIAHPEVFNKYKAKEPSRFPFLPDAYGLDPVEREKIEQRRKAALATETGKTKSEAPADSKPKSFFFKVEGAGTEEKVGPYTEDDRLVFEASITADRETLKADSYIPAAMAVIYLGLLVYFASTGGYRVYHIDGTVKKSGEH